MPKRNKTTPFQISRRERDAEVLRLRRADHTYHEIHALTGMDVAEAHRLVQKHLAEIPAADAEELRTWERQKLNEIERSARPQAYDFFAEIGADGKPVMENVCDDNGVAMLNEDGSPMMRVRRDWNIANQGRALLLKTHERRCKMFGLDEATKMATTFESIGDGSSGPIDFSFRVVDAGAGHPLIQNCSPEELLLVLRFIEEQGFGQGQKLIESSVTPA